MNNEFTLPVTYPSVTLPAGFSRTGGRLLYTATEGEKAKPHAR